MTRVAQRSVGAEPGGWASRWERLGLIAMGAIGASLLLIVAVYRWGTPSDEHAYWAAAQRLLAGSNLYDPGACPGTPYAYWYPPPLAQVLAPLTTVFSSDLFSAAWTVLMLACLWWLAGRRPLVALALVVFLPVAVEFWYRNVHLILAVLLVLAIRRAPWLFAVAAAIKVTPVLGVVYLAARGRWRDVLSVCAVGAAMLVVSVAVSPAAWSEFVSVVLPQGPTMGASILPVPFAFRAVVALILAIAAGRMPIRYGEPLLVVAIVVGSPTLWATTLSMLVAILPLARTGARETHAAPAPAPVPASV